MNIQKLSSLLRDVQEDEERKKLSRHFASQKKQPPKQPPAGQKSAVQKVQSGLSDFE